MMNSRDYWAMRAAQDMVDRMGTAEQTAAEISAAVGQSSKYLAGEVKAVLRGIEGFGISEAEAIQIIRAAGDGNVLQRFRRIAQQVADPERRRALMNAIDSAGAYRYRINRIGELYNDIDSTCRKLYQTENLLTSSALRSVAEDSYYHELFNIQQRAGLWFSFSKYSRRDVDRILRANWLGGNYSGRIWKNLNGLSEQLKRELLVSMLTGRSSEKTARIFQECFGVNAYCARRIVRTESAYVANAAQSRAYEEAGIERYRFIATLDSKTSEVCAELDGRVFDLSKAKPGKNYPPMHPFCRSTTIADFGDEELAGLERRAKDENGNTIKVPADMTYQEWYGKYVEGIEQPNSGSRETETAALSGSRQVQIAEHQTAPALIAPTVDGREVVLTSSGDFLAFRHVDGLTDEQVSDIITDRRKQIEAYRENWARYSLSDTISRLIPNAVASPITPKGKINYSQEDKDIVICYDSVFDYFRIHPKGSYKQTSYRDIDGNTLTANITGSNGKQIGRTKDNRMMTTHFDNSDFRK